MKWIGLFRAVINLMYIFAVISLIAAPIALYLAITESDFNLTVSGSEITNNHWSFYVVLVLALLGYLAFVRMLYFMNAAAQTLKPRNLFDPQVASFIIKAGKNCMLAALLTKVPVLLYQFLAPLTNSPTQISFSVNFFYGFDTLFVIISFGFFLMLTGIVMKEGNTLKQENDLTI